MKSPTLSQCLTGYFVDAASRRLSEHTVSNYRRTFKRFAQWLDTKGLGDLQIGEITAEHVKRFLAGHAARVSKKTQVNYHTALSALMSWAVREGLLERNVVHDVQPPKPEVRAVTPFTEQEMRAMLKAAEFITYTRDGREVTQRARMGRRNRATLMLLLDTGIRASELCGLRVKDCDLKNLRVKVFGKGARERFVSFTAPTAKAVMRYLWTRGELDPDDWLIANDEGGHWDRSDMGRTVRTIGQRAGVPNAYPHRFRHTFGFTWLQNGGSESVLQGLLGHSSRATTQRYVALAQVDTGRLHKMFSPVVNWRL